MELLFLLSISFQCYLRENQKKNLQSRRHVNIENDENQCSKTGRYKERKQYKIIIRNVHFKGNMPPNAVHLWRERLIKLLKRLIRGYYTK